MAKKQETANAFQMELHGQMQADALDFADFMLANRASHERLKVRELRPRRYSWLGSKEKDVEDELWVVRGHESTNYGGFPLFWVGDDSGLHDAYQRLAINTRGELRRLLSFGDEAKLDYTDGHSITSEIATPDDAIACWAVNSQEDVDNLRVQWLSDLVGLVLEYTDLELSKIQDEKPSDTFGAHVMRILPEQ